MRRAILMSCWIGMTLVFCCLAIGQQKVSVPELTNQELSQKVFELEARIEVLEQTDKQSELRLTAMENSLQPQVSPLVKPGQSPAPSMYPIPKVNPMWGLVKWGMTEDQVVQLIGNPVSVSGADYWKQWNYQGGGHVVFTRPAQPQKFGLQLPEETEYTVGEWISPKP